MMDQPPFRICFLIHSYASRVLLLVLFALGFLSACSTPAPPQSGFCVTSNDCASQESCQQNVCVVMRTSDGGMIPWSEVGLPDSPTEPTPESKPEITPETICKDGSIEDCDTGRTGTCGPGYRLCRAGKWGTCTQKSFPTPEECDGKDNNCDGQIDENVTRTCYTGPSGTAGKGECQSGTQTCSNGTFGTCQNAIVPQSDTCDGKDNDCDGVIDEGCDCAPDGKTPIGVCANNKRQKDGTCPVPKDYERNETKCDKLDNDCDGQIDEGCTCVDGTTQECGSNIGICKKGKETCRNGQWGPCQGETKASPQEICNGLDDDCNGKTDDGIPFNLYYRDNDGDGYGDPNIVKSACQLPKGYVRNNRDCNDDTAQNGGNIHPGQPELCDGIDNDCNGKIDERWPKKGQSCDVGKGICQRTGNYTCNASKQGIICNVSSGTPQTEVCDGKDNDCDGSVDENWPDKGKVCFVGKGICLRKGYNVCDPATGNIRCNVIPGTPQKEVCDAQGLDENCDGTVNEGCDCVDNSSRLCYDTNQKGCVKTPTGYTCNNPCIYGKQECIGGKWDSLCKGMQTPTSEICDNKDNDCDGVVDNNLSRACTTICGSGKQFCTAGVWGACDAKQPTTEVCDGKDNDCDGNIDEPGMPVIGSKCTAQQFGPCSNGTFICNSGRVQCQPGQPTTEICNGIDDDCNGKVDDNSASPNQACTITGASRSACLGGLLVCDPSASSKTKCKPLFGQGTFDEHCDGYDNDCDGQIDENAIGTGDPCVLNTAPLNNRCQAGMTTKCNGGRLECSNPQVLPTVLVEVCDNGIDDDCNGSIDQGIHCTLFQSCSTIGTTRPCYLMNKAGCPGGNCQGICSAGTQECIKKTTGGQVWSECKGAVAPKPEICNGKDDDCDGNVDELSPSFFSSGFCKVPSETGPCELGKQTCLNGQLVCMTLYNKQAETCNAKDDDCNGVIDDIQTGQSCKVPNLKGPCQQGTKICKRGIEFCAQATRPTTEKCGNGKDDNCDGNVDEPGCTP